MKSIIFNFVVVGILGGPVAQASGFDISPKGVCSSLDGVWGSAITVYNPKGNPEVWVPRVTVDFDKMNSAGEAPVTFNTILGGTIYGKTSAKQFKPAPNVDNQFEVTITYSNGVQDKYTLACNNREYRPL